MNCHSLSKVGAVVNGLICIRNMLGKRHFIFSWNGIGHGFYMLTHQNIDFYLENCLLTYSDTNLCSCFGVENSPEVCPSVFLYILCIKISYVHHL